MSKVSLNVIHHTPHDTKRDMNTKNIYHLTGYQPEIDD